MVVKPTRRVPTNVLSRPQPVQRDVSTPQMQPNVMQPKPVQTIATKPQIKAPTEVRNFGLGSAEGGPVQAPTQVNTTTPRPQSLATRENPMISVSTQPQQIDIESADMGTLLREQDAIQYKIASGSFTQDDFVRGREIARKLADQMNPTPTMEANPLLTQLEQQAEQLSTRDRSPEVEARRSMLQSQFDTRRAQLEENARRARDSTIGNIAMAGGGRSSVAQQAELDIQRELQNQINAEQQAMELELRAYEAQLQGADSEQLQSIYTQINELKGQAAQSQMILNQKAEEQKMASVNSFNQTLQQLATSSGIQLDPNDEKALEQVINIARNPDGSVNEEVVAGLPREYQALVRAGVMNGVGRQSFTPKVERIGGTTKSPVFGYRDPNQQRFVTTNAMGVPTGGTVRAGGGGGMGGGGAISQLATDIQGGGSEYYNENNRILYNAFINSGGTTTPTEKQVRELGGIENFQRDAIEYYKRTVQRDLSGNGRVVVTNIEPYIDMPKETRQIIKRDTDAMINLITAFDRAIDAAKKASPLDLSNTQTPGGRKLSEALISGLMQQKEKYNLGVLNGPDLELLARELPQPSIGASLRGKTDFVNSYINARNRAIEDFNNRNSQSYGVKLNYGLMGNYGGDNKENTQPTVPSTGALPVIVTPNSRNRLAK